MTSIYDLNFEKQKIYTAGRKSKEEEIINMINNIKTEEFLSIGNTENDTLNFLYKIEENIIDKIVERIKKGE